MAREETIKHRYEKWAADTLVAALGLHAHYLRHGDEVSEPDIIYQTQESSLGVEVTTAYYSDGHARAVWDQAKTVNDVLEGFNRPVAPMEEPDRLLASRIQLEIQAKIRKPYYGTLDTLLCVVEHAPLSDEAGLKAALEQVTIPPNQFAGIYLLRRSRGEGYHAVRLA